MGVAGSGKTTVARALAAHYGALYLDADDLHTREARAQMAAGIPLTDAQRAPWVAAVVASLQRATAQGGACVLAFSGLRAAHRQHLRDSGVPVRFVFLHAPPDVIAARLVARHDHFMPPELLASQCDTLQSPVGEPDVVSIDVSGAFAEVLARVIAALEQMPGYPDDGFPPH